MNEGENIERLESAVQKLLATVSFLQDRNREALARIQDMEEGGRARDAEIEKLKAERKSLLDRVERVIADIDAATVESPDSSGGEDKDENSSQGTLNLSA